MFKLWVADTVWNKIADLENHLIDELKLSEEAALQRTNRMRVFLKKINQTTRYPLCRFRPWFGLGYRCILFEKSWVFAYELFEGGIIIRDMSHTALLKDVT
ncbi:MAG: hypothetical protein LBD21_09730 [Tannerellaceae bacterium]|jgi:hypothetical protein|nr:hypothetical protein [Tannerellaceae bacterium]